MARGFVLTAALQLQAPRNVNAIVSGIQRRLNSINTNINIRINAAATRNVNNLNRGIQGLNRTLSAFSVTASAAAADMNNLAAAFRASGINLSAFNQSARTTSNSLNNTTRSANQAGDAIENFTRAGVQAIKRYASFATATSGVYALINAVKSGIDEATTFQSEIVKISQVTNVSVRDLAGLEKEVTRLSTSLGVSSAKLINVSQILAQAGLSAREVKVGLEALAKTELAATFTDVERTVEGAIASMRQFDIGAQDLEKTLGSFNTVAGAFAVESDDIVTAVRRAGASFAASGGSLNEFIALFTSVRQTTRESAETIATGFRTIFTRFQRPKTIEFLRQLGVELTDIEGKFVGPYEAIRRLSSGLANIDTRDLKFAEVVEELGGFRQVSKVIPLIKEFAVAERALGVAIRGETSLSKDAEVAQQSFLVQLTKIREEFNALFRSIGNDSAIQSFGKLMLQLASNAIKLADALTPLIPLITTIGTVKIGGALLSAGRGLTRRNEGGKIHRFARGGLVPGSGNRDTVPSLLQPGEFVLTKKAVESMGAHNLAGMNRYANGGRVGVVSLNQTAKASPITVTGKDVALDKYGHKIKGELPPGLTKFYKTYDVANSSLFDTKQEVDNMLGQVGVENILRQGVSAITQGIAGKIGADPVKAADIKGRIPNYNSIIGGLFEGALANIGQPYDNHAGYEQAPFDFPSGLAASKLGAIPTDAKKTFSKDTSKSLKGKIAVLARQQYAAEIETAYADAIARGAAKQLQAGKAPVLSGDKTGFLSAFDSGKAVPKQFGLSQQEAKAILESAGKTFKGARSGSGFSFLNTGQKPLFKAAGGIGSHTDTVPALLTPGEFVINKKSAQAIGYGQLNKMNKVHKYARGGTVGGTSQLGVGAALLAPTLFAGVAELGVESKETAESLTRVTQQLGIAAALISSFGKTIIPTSRDMQALGVSLRNTIRINRQAPLSRGLSGRANRVLGGFATGGLLATAGAGLFAGDVLSRAGESRLTKGDVGGFGDFRTGSGLSGASTGLGTGAAIGSIAGPLGSVAGGLIGAVIGYASAVEEADKKAASLLSQNYLEKSLKGLEKIDTQVKLGVVTQKEGATQRIDKLRFSQLSAESSQKEIDALSGIYDFKDIDPYTRFGVNLRRLTGTGPKGEERTRAQINAAQGRVNSNKQLQAQENDFLTQTLNERVGKSNSSAEFFSNQENSTVFELLNKQGLVEIAEIEKAIKARKDGEATTKKFNDAQLKAIAELTKFADATTSVVSAYSKASDTLDRGLAIFSGGRISNGQSELLGSFDTAINASTTAGKLQQRNTLRSDIVSKFGGGTLGNQGATAVADSNFAQAVLPQIIEKLRTTKELSGTDNSEAFIRELKAAGITDKNSIDKLTAGFANVFNNPSRQEDLSQTNEELSTSVVGLLKNQSDAIKKAYEAQASFNNKLQEVYTKRLEVEAKTTELSLKQIDLREQLFTSQQTFKNPNYQQTVGQAQRFQDRRLQEINGGRAVNLENAPADIALLRSKAAAAAEKGDVQSFNVLSTAANRLVKSLEFAAGSTDVLTAKQNALAKVQSERETKRAFVEDLAFAGNDGRKQILEDVNNAFKVAANPLLTGDSQQESGALRILQTFKDQKVFGNLTGDEVIKQRVKATAQEIGARTGLSPQDAEKLANELINPTSKEKELQAAIELEFEKLIGLNQDLKAIENQQLVALQTIAGQAQANAQGAANAAGLQVKAGGGRIGYFAKGGMFKPKGTDTVPAMLTPGEFIVSRGAARNIGYGNLNSMNTMYAAAGGATGLKARLDAAKAKIAERQVESKRRLEKGRAEGITDEKFNSHLKALYARGHVYQTGLTPANAKDFGGTAKEKKEYIDSLYLQEAKQIQDFANRARQSKENPFQAIGTGPNGPTFSPAVVPPARSIPTEQRDAAISARLATQAPSAPANPFVFNSSLSRPVNNSPDANFFAPQQEAAIGMRDAASKQLDAARIYDKAVDKMPHKVDHEVKTIDVNVTGLSAEILKALLGPLKELIVAEASKAIVNFAKNNLNIDVPKL